MMQMPITEFTIAAEQAGRRIDMLMSERSGLTRSQVRRLIKDACLTVNGKSTKPNYKARSADIVRIFFLEERKELLPEDLPIEVLFRDDFVIVVNKPPGMVVYPSAGHSSGTLMNAVAFHAPKLASVGAPLRPGVVHRLDRDTSGVMVVALDDRVYYDLVEQFRSRTIIRKYCAVVFGILRADEGRIDRSIGRSASDRKKMSTRSRRGKAAVTTWRVIERFPAATLVEARLGTGRTHQIRVHFASIGHPVLGDRTYGAKSVIDVGKRKITCPRQMLHAELLGFTHPVTRKQLEFSVPPPEDMASVMSLLRAA